MANLNRQDERLGRPPVSSTVNSISPAIHLLEKFTTLAPFLQSLLKELATKYAKIRCAVANVQEKIIILNENSRNVTLPRHMNMQQKFINSLDNMDTKTEMIQHILNLEKQKCETILTDLQAKYNDHFIEMESYLDTNMAYKKNIDTIKPFLTAMIENNYHTMKLKMFKDKQKRDAKHEKFMKKKEEDESEVTVKAKDIKRLLNEIQELKINQAKLLKKVNGKGEKHKPKKMAPLPNQQKAKPKNAKKPSGGKSNKSRNNGRTKNSSKKQQL